MRAGQCKSASDFDALEDIARSACDLVSQEAGCRRFFTEQRRASIGLMEDAFNIYLDAIHIASGHGWKSYSQIAVLQWSLLTFHTARAAFLLALSGYFPQFHALERSLADQALLCVLLDKRPEYAEKLLRGGWVPDANKVLPMLDEDPWPGYDILHAYVHGRVEAVAYYVQPAPSDEMKLDLGPRDDPELFDEAVTSIGVFLLLAAQTLGFAWQPVRQNEAWWEKFKPLIDRTVALVERVHGARS